jgi:Golgi SNAP receptor complex protein 1
MSSATFTQTRSQALNLEKQTESLLSRYSQFQNIPNSTLASEDETKMHESIVETLDKRDSIITKLNRISESDQTISTSKLQQLARHKEILNEHRKSLNRIQSNIEQDRNRNNLLFSVQSDISAHQKRNRPETNSHDYILDERERVDNANSFADRLLQLAYQTRDELLEQRQNLNNASLRMMGSLSAIPGLNVLIGKINTRRRRDTLILATVIAVCIVILFFV